MKTNKELIESLTEYFNTQDIKIVSRTLANMMVDYHRMVNFDSLPLKEQECFIHRSINNSKELDKFSKEGPKGNLELTNLEY